MNRLVWLSVLVVGQISCGSSSEDDSTPTICDPAEDACRTGTFCDPMACVPSCPTCLDCNPACVPAVGLPLCCDPAQEPGVGDNPICFEGANCCADGSWKCNEGDGITTCDAPGDVCEESACCDPALEPGVGDSPICFEGASCCADGSWQCNEGDGTSTCDASGDVCE